LIVIGLLLILVVFVGAKRQVNEITEEIDVPFTEEELNSLGNALENLEFDDLGGLTGDDFSSLSFDEADLDSLEQALQGLEYEDLGGLTEN
jgi:hypothetical protein